MEITNAGSMRVFMQRVVNRCRSHQLCEVTFYYTKLGASSVVETREEPIRLMVAEEEARGHDG